MCYTIISKEQNSYLSFSFFANISLLATPREKTNRTEFEDHKILYKKDFQSFLSRIDRLRDIRIWILHDDFKRAK